MYILKNGKKTNVSIHGFDGFNNLSKDLSKRYNAPLWLIILIIILILLLLGLLLYILLK